MLGKSRAHTQFGGPTGGGCRAGPGRAERGSRVTPGQDEFALIEALRARFEAPEGGLSHGDLGIGDDAAAVTLPGPGRVVLATDLVVEGVHVDRAVSTPEDIGWKALMAAVSDIGAMGCAPSHALLSVAAPAGFPIDRLGDGVAEAAAAAGCVVVGGDLSASPVLVVSVTAIGPAGHDGTRLLTRAGAQPGDRLFVTGPTGGSAAGLRLLSAAASTVPPTLSAAHRRPVARLREGVAARGAGASAAVDISDGLVGDLVRLAEASGVGLDLVVDDTVVAVGATRNEALAGGEDYELVLATPDPDALLVAFAAAGLRPPLAIGMCTERSAGSLLDGGPLPPGGWRHEF
jgi:thiamine-monophosphate kinase